MATKVVKALDVAELQSILQKQNATWKAGPNPIMQLPREERLKRLGANPPGGRQALKAREQQGKANVKMGGHAAKAVGFPAAYDWRNVGGNNFVTPIRDQGGCGSCVAFGSTATVEGMVQISRNDPNTGVDLSEAHLFFCCGPATGASCNNGWWPDNALDCYKNPGVSDEACFPYVAMDQACTACADWQSRVTLISGWHQITSTDDMKTWLSSNGPLN